MPSQDVINLFGSSNFRVVLPTAPVCRQSASEIRITSHKFTFSNMTAAEMGYPDHACLFISDDATKLVVKGCSPAEYSFPFCMKDENGKIIKKAISTGNYALSQVIRNKLGWDQKSCYVCNGMLYQEEQLILFDLTQAFIRKRQYIKKMVPQEVFESYPSLYEVMGYKPLMIPAQSDTPAT